MKIALPTRDDQTISGHFAKMKAFIMVDVIDGVVTARERRDMSGMPPCGSDHSAKPKFVVNKISDCDVLIASGIGFAMRDLVTEATIEVVLTRERLIDKAIERYTKGTLMNDIQLAHSPR
jgi:predicted Fe-Mo cluster-binding NifX family protein